MEAARAIAAEVDPEPLEFGSGRLVGSVSQHDFRLRCIGASRNWMRPVIEGTILPRPDGCAISITMHAPRNAALLAAALLVPLLAALLLLLMQPDALRKAHLLSSGLISSYVAITTFALWKSFAGEADNAEALLIGILGAQRAL